MSNLLEKFAARLGFLPKDTVHRALMAHSASARQFRRTYEAGQVTRLNGDFIPAQISTDADLISRLRLMRIRSRYLFKNEPYARRYARLIQKNVVGPSGVQLSILNAKHVRSSFGLSPEDSALIEARWTAWGSSRFVTTDERMTWPQVQRLAASNGVIEGEAFSRVVLSTQNPFLVSLQFWVPDQFDEQLNSTGQGTQVRMAIESALDTGKRVAYWPWQVDPGDPYGRRRIMGQRVRIPAGEMVHWFIPDFVNQSRGVPWLFSTIPQLNMLNGYAEAELVASRIAASKMGFFIPPEGSEYTGQGTDSAGNTLTEASPGTFEELAAGTEFKAFDPQHPNANFAAFQKAMLRGTSAGGDVSYHTLSGDLEGVNYSSARIGLLDERDGYALLQDEFISGFCTPIFRLWLIAQAVLGAIPLSPAEAETFDDFVWRPRRWSWVDPQKEINAATQAVALRIKSRTQICADMGDDFPQTAQELSDEAELLEELDIAPETPAGGAILPDDDEEEKPKTKPAKSGRGHFTVTAQG